MKPVGLFISAYVLALSSLVWGADDSDAGKKAEERECVACHSLRLIETQRLSAAAWQKEVDKMIGWGAVVSDKQLLVDFLSKHYSNTQPPPSAQLSTDSK